MKVVVPLAPGFEEIEMMAIVDVLRRGEVEVYLAGITEPPIVSARGVKVIPDISIDEVTDYDAVVLPGGNPGYLNLASDERVLKLVKDAHRVKKYVAAICAAPSVLGKAGIMEGITATRYPGIEIIGAKYSDERVVRDGTIITSQGPGTAIDFSLFLVEIFVGKATSETVRKAILA